MTEFRPHTWVKVSLAPRKVHTIASVLGVDRKSQRLRVENAYGLRWSPSFGRCEPIEPKIGDVVAAFNTTWVILRKKGEDYVCEEYMMSPTLPKQKMTNVIALKWMRWVRSQK